MFSKCSSNWGLLLMFGMCNVCWVYASLIQVQLLVFYSCLYSYTSYVYACIFILCLLM